MEEAKREAKGNLKVDIVLRREVRPTVTKVRDEHLLQ